jgi:hypothetical protein
MSSLKEKYPVLVARATTDPKAARMLELLATAERAFAQRACTRIESRKRRGLTPMKECSVRRKVSPEISEEVIDVRVGRRICGGQVRRTARS